MISLPNHSIPSPSPRCSVYLFNLWLLLALCGFAPVLAAEIDISSDQNVPVETPIPADFQLSTDALNRAKAMTLFSQVLINLRKDQGFSKATLDDILTVLELDPQARQPLQLLLASWAKKGMDFYKASIERLLRIAKANPDAFRLNLVTVLALNKLDRTSEGIELLENVIDGYDPERQVSEEDRTIFTDMLITLIGLYQNQKRYDDGHRLIRNFQGTTHFRDNARFHNAAVLFYHQAAKDSDNSRWLWFLEGDKDRYARMMKEHLDAIPLLKSDISPGEIAVLLEVYRETGSLAKAKTLLLEYLINDPDDYNALVLLAAVYHDLQEDQNAYRVWRCLVEHEKSNGEHYLRLGAAAMLCHRYDDAVRAYEWFLVFKPDDPVVLYQTAYALFELEQYHKAISKLKTLDAIPDALFLTALCWKNLDDYPKALACMIKAEKAAEKTEDSKLLKKNFYLTFALIAEKAKNMAEAERVLDKLLLQTPDDPEVLNFLGYILADHNLQIDKAITLLEKAVKIKPDSSAFLDSLAWALYRKGDYKIAAETIRKAIEIDKGSSDPVIIDHAGDIFLALGDVPAAIKYWKDALIWYSPELDPAKIDAKIRQHASP